MTARVQPDHPSSIRRRWWWPRCLKTDAAGRQCTDADHHGGSCDFAFNTAETEPDVTNRYRKARGAQTQRVVAEYLTTQGWPYATDAGAGRSGRDILGVDGVSIEVKARRDLNLPAWIRQARAAAGNDLPVVVHRPDGMGPASIADWPATLRLADLVALLHEAGRGTEAA